MAKIFPFRAIRAPRDKVGLVASRSYINYTKSDLKSRLVGNPYTFLHVLNPDNSIGQASPRSRTARFLNIKKKLESFVEEGHLFKDDTPALYIYRQESKDFAFFGLICGISIDEYLSGKIKIHENTLTRKERLFKQYLDTTRFNAEPVLLTHKPMNVVNKIIDKYSKRFPDYDFRTTDTVRHQLWVIKAKTDIQLIQKSYSKLDALYLADGHHRSASSALLAKSDRRKKIPGIGQEMFMVLNVPEDQLRILAFDRVVKDLNGLTKENFLSILSEYFKIKEVHKENGFRPKKVHRFGIYIEGKWYRAILRKKYRVFESPVEELDVHLLGKRILEPILGIIDQKNDRRVSFIGGHEDVSEIERLVDKKKFKVGFSLFPVSTSQLKAIADANEVMPPKSTWIEPKLRSGLTIMDLNDSNDF
jgi:uncharacterized protein (DUF1015 family)